MEKIKDAVAAVGEYNKGGEIKKRYQKLKLKITNLFILFIMLQEKKFLMKYLVKQL